MSTTVGAGAILLLALIALRWIGVAVGGERIVRERYETLLESLDVAVWERDLRAPANGYMSPQIESILGFSPSMIVGSPDFWESRIHPEDLEGFRRSRQEAFDSDAATQELEYRMISASGQIVWVRSRMSIERDRTGNAIFARGVTLDVSMYKRFAAELQSSLARLKDAAEERRTLVTRFLSAQEHEREFVRSKLHDDSLQLLAAVGYGVNVLRHRLGDEESRHLLDNIEGSVRMSIAALRELAESIIPRSVLAGGLASAIRALAQRTSTDAHMIPSVETELEAEPTPEIAAALYRVARVGVENAAQAGAKKIDVRIVPSLGGLLLEITHDGRRLGEDETAPHGGYSVTREWVALLGGRLCVHDEPGRANISMWTPLRSLQMAEATAGDGPS